MEKRTILAIALSFLVLMGFQLVSQKFNPPEQPSQIVENTVEKPKETPPEPYQPLSDTTPDPFSETTPDPSLVSSATDTKTDGPKEVIVQGALYQAVVESKGAVLSSWILNDYKSSHSEASQRKPFEMIAARDEGDTWSHPGSLIFEDPNTSVLANDQLYEATVNGQPYLGTPLSVPVDVVLTLRRGDLAIQKTYSFKEENYTVDFSATFVKGGRELEGQFLIGQDLGPIEEHLQGRYTELEAAYFNGEKVKRESAPDVDEEDVTISGNIRWVGLDMHYFSAIAIPEKPLPSFDIRGFEINSTTLEGDSIERSLLSLKIPVDGSLDCQLYLGPKMQANLKAVSQYDLSEVIDYGIFSIIALPLLSALRWIHQYVGNYGFAIILLTLLLSILLFPLRLKQMMSMKKMQVVQPQVKAIQEKYKKYKKTDPKRAEMNQEVMALYKANNVNPLGGCLPMLPQMPLLFAFYSLLANCIELRQAPFIFWLQDLAAKDPMYILPVLMGITMFLSQKLTPMSPTADDSQMKMMKYLPVIFTIMFFGVSSGLNLYFLCSNIFQVGFQKIAERFMSNGKNVSKSKQIGSQKIAEKVMGDGKNVSKSKRKK